MPWASKPSLGLPPTSLALIGAPVLLTLSWALLWRLGAGKRARQRAQAALKEKDALVLKQLGIGSTDASGESNGEGMSFG